MLAWAAALGKGLTSRTQNFALPLVELRDQIAAQPATAVLLLEECDILVSLHSPGRGQQLKNKSRHLCWTDFEPIVYLIWPSLGT